MIVNLVLAWNHTIREPVIIINDTKYTEAMERANCSSMRSKIKWKILKRAVYSSNF